MIDVYQLDKRISSELRISQEKLEQRTIRYITSFLINTNLLHRIFDVLEEIHMFFPLQNKHTSSWGDLIPLDELFSVKKHDDSGLGHFEDLLMLVNIAIVQQNLLAGDKLLDLFYQRLFIDNISREESEYVQIVQTLKKNKLFSANFAKYFVKRQLEKERRIPSNEGVARYKFDFFEYNLFLSDTSSLARDIRNISNLRMCFDERLQSQIVFHENRWKLDLYPDDREAYLVMPDSDMFLQGEIKYRRELLELQNLKAKILDKISEYEFESYIDVNNPIFNNLRFN
jgi:hypothetical protein